MMRFSRDKLYRFSDAVIEYAFYLLLFALPFAKALVETAATLMIVGWFGKRLLVCLAAKSSFGERLRLCRPVQTYLNLPLTIYLCAVALSVFLSSNHALSIKSFFFKTFEYILLFFITAELIKDRKRLARTIGVMLVSATMVGLDSVLQQLVGFDILRHYPLEAQRSTGSFQMPGSLGGYMGPLALIVLALVFLRFTRKVRYLLRLLALLLLGVLVTTFSRGAWLGFTVGALFLGLLENKKIVFTVLAILAIFALVLPMVINTPYSVVERLKSFSFSASSANLDRQTIWKIALTMIKDRPVFGYGLNTFMGTFVRYGEEFTAYKIQGIVPYAHNCYLQIAAESGIVGLLSFLFLIGTFFLRSIISLRSFKKGFAHAVLAGVSAGICATLAHSAVDTNLYSLQLAVLFWCLLGINAALQRGVSFEE